MAGYPMELNLLGKRVLVVGFGPVGQRKAWGLLASGARVRVVDPAPCRDQRTDTLEILAEPYVRAHLEGVALAFAAATAEVNRQVVSDAKSIGVWVNSATEPEAGDFILPACWQEGPLTLSVSTSGASPALAAMLRDRARDSLGPAAVALASVLAELRPLVFARVPDPAERRALLTRWADPALLKRCQLDGPDSVRAFLLESLERQTRREWS
jgi:siroheme synthase-like protein